MRSRPERVEESLIADAIADGWGVHVGDLRYFPEGGGAYHWIARDDDARRWFVTCDDLDTKPWLGRDRDEVFIGLEAAYRTASDLRAAGLGFVAAPIAATSGPPAVRLDGRHSLSLLHYVDGEPGRWGRPLAAGERLELVTMLARLHQATLSTPGLHRRGLEIPGREGLDEALDDLDEHWQGGPLSEPARQQLARHRDAIVRSLDELDGLAARFAGPGAAVVLTHGEPHPGNLLRTPARLLLLDWDTVALARPERDLWMLAGDAEALTRYEDITGIALDHDALHAHRELWALADVAAFTAQLRGEHRHDEDARKALDALESILDGDEPSPHGLP